MTAKRSSRPIWLGEDERTWDHFRVHLDVLRSRSMGVYEFATYCGLVAHAEVNTGEARPSAPTLASYYGAGERRIREAIGWLEEHGWIRVERTKGAPSRYFVLPPPTPASHAGVDNQTAASHANRRGTTTRATPAPRADEQEPANKNQEPDPSAPKVAKAARLPDSFPLTEAMWAWALDEQGYSEAWVREQTHAFCDYWRARPGAGALKLDWVATWRNWLRRAASERTRPLGARGRPDVVERNRANMTEALRLLEGGRQ